MKKLMLCTTALVIAVSVTACFAQRDIRLELSDRFDSGLGEGAAEILSFDVTSQRLFVVNAVQRSIDVLAVNKDATMHKIKSIDLSTYKAKQANTFSANSVAAANGMFAVAIENRDAQDHQMTGSVVLFDARSLSFINQYEAGYLPDMLSFNKKASMLLVANEGEPSDDYSFDPEGSITRIDIASNKVTQIDFKAFNVGALKHDLIDKEVRIFGRYQGQTASVAQDLEPEYISIADDNSTAWVSLQENNAIASINLETNQVTRIRALGVKKYDQFDTAIDSSDKDNGINIIPRQQVVGMYQPDAIANYRALDGKRYIVTANEGDARDYAGFSEEVRVADLDNLAPQLKVDAQDETQLGRLKTSTTEGDTDGDGLIDTIYSYGARSFSIWDDQGQLVFDSGNQFIKQVVEAVGEDYFVDKLDKRSDDKGVEPEAVVVGQIGLRSYAFIGLERAGGVMVYDITIPQRATFIDYVRTEQDIAPEGLVFIPAAQSPTKKPLLAVSNEVSGTTVLYEIKRAPIAN